MHIGQGVIRTAWRFERCEIAFDNSDDSVREFDWRDHENIVTAVFPMVDNGRIVVQTNRNVVSTSF
jgi:hypothetical protein